MKEQSLGEAAKAYKKLLSEKKKIDEELSQLGYKLDEFLPYSEKLRISGYPLRRPNYNESLVSDILDKLIKGDV